MNMEYNSIHNAVPYSLPYNFFFFLVMVLIVGAPAEASTPLCLSNQSSALLQFKRSIDLLPDRLSSWKEDTDCCRWEGVTCDSLSGYVTELRIPSALERSSMTLDHSLFRLSHLRVLDLRDNRFSGTIPKRVAELTRLTHLDLSDCSFSGEVPKEMSRLTRLVYLDLSWNDDLQLDSSILPLGSLSYLDLSGNTLSSPPEFFPNFTSLRVLKLSNCGLASFTSGIFLLPKLEMLDVSNNGNLVASLPSEVIPPSSNIRRLDISGARKLYGDLRVLSNLTKLMHLDLRYSAINGSIPPSWALERITVLYLSSNNLSGSIPEGICSSSNLTQLHLSHNSLTGTIPPCLFNLSHLEQIDLRGNLLSSGISSPRFNLPFINSIYLSQNFLTGSIHSSIFNLPTLRYLHLHDNRLTGEIAATIVNLDSLLESRLSNNMLTGSIPSFLFNLSNLNTLDLRDNKFSGSIPSINQISVITELFLGNNCLSGDVTSIGKPGLGRLDLSSNCFSGAILFPFFNLESLELLDFSNNKALTGLESSNSSYSYDGTGSLHLLNLSWCAFDGFPRVLGNLQHRNYMAVLDLSDNDIRGNIPSWFWGIFDTVRLVNNEIEGFEAVNRSSIRARDLRVFAAHNNHIAGEIPSFICKNFTQLEVLDVSNNDLAGTIPNCLGRMEQLAVLALANNRLRGQIPAFTSPFAEVISFNNNLLSGKIDPRALHNCTGLQVLDVGDNRLNDTFPSWLSSFDKLRVLILRSNHLHGPITLSGSAQVEFPSLQIFDISGNHFSGSLPVELFKNLKAMMAANESEGEHDDDRNDLLGWDSRFLSALVEAVDYVKSMYYFPGVVQTIKRMTLSLPKIKSTPVIIDLSNNMFTGKIPEEMGMLKELYALNISNNNLGGTIPTSLGNLKQLGALDLSHNRLSGVIPVELSSGLTFLAVLNLSYNELHGKIPEGDQFGTFDETSFEGNPGLCGSQVNRSCSVSGRDDDGVHHQAIFDKQEDKHWEYGALGFAAGILMMVVPIISSGRFGSWHWNIIDRATVFLMQVCHLPKAPKRSHRV